MRIRQGWRRHRRFGLTEHFEASLEQINMGALDKQDFLDSLTDEIRKNIDYFSKPVQERLQNIQDSVGKCPKCGREIRENQKAYGCTGYKEGCSFVIWKTIAGKSITSAQAKQLLTKGKTTKLKGFNGKKGKFDAALVLKADGTVGFQI